MADLVGVKKIFNVRILIIIILLMAFAFILIDITKMYYKCPPNKIEYRYVPRSFNDEQNNPVPLKNIFGKMFNNPSPWVNSFTEVPNVASSNVRQN